MKYKKLKNWMYWWGPAVIWMGVIFIASSLPHRLPTPGLDFRLDDKFQHALAYAVLGALMWRALNGKATGWKRMWMAFILTAVYALTDECHQSLTPNRRCDPLDLIADAIGALATVVILQYKDRRR